MKSQFIGNVPKMLLAAAVAIVPGMQARARGPGEFQVARFEAVGFQADASSPLILQGEPIGNAVWHVLNAPPVSNPFGFLLADSSFSGAACQADYTRAEIVTGDGSSLNLEVYGFRCDPNASAAAATTTGLPKKIGIYSVVGGTGTFQDLIGGTGSIAFDSRLDGSVFVSIQGSLIGVQCGTCHVAPQSLPKSCQNGVCGSTPR